MRLFRRSDGFTLIELVVTVAIIGFITGVAFINHGSFAGKSLLRVRVAELGEYIRLAQDLSGSAEILSSTSPLPSKGFQVVRLKVRDGLLKTFQIEKVPGSFTKFDKNSNFGQMDTNLSESRTVTLDLKERYFVDVCFINTDASPQHTRKELILGGDQDCSTESMLCTSPDPLAADYNAEKTKLNNFDIHFSVEQPAREVHANVIPVLFPAGVETYKYQHVQPNGSFDLVSEKYEGVRVTLISKKGDKRGIDVYRTGLISFNAEKSASCEVEESANTECEARLERNCDLFDTLHGGTSGDCVSGFDGSCSYRCDNGDWIPEITNSCAAQVTDGLCRTVFPPGEIPSSGNGCLDGRYSEIQDDEEHYRWQCLGSNGGNNPRCNYPLPTCGGGDIVQWGDESNPCRGARENTASGSEDTVENTADGTTGSAIYTCNNGEWSGPTGATCDLTPAQACGGGDIVQWGDESNPCRGARENTASGSEDTVENTADGTTGSAIYTCNNGEWSGPTGATCDLTPAQACGGGDIVQWGDESNPCRGARENTASGSEDTVENTADGTTGSAIYTCNNGEWSGPTGATCDLTPAQACGGGDIVQWGDESNPCRGARENTASGSEDTVENTADGTTGSAIYTCNNGEWSGPTGATCDLTPAQGGEEGGEEVPLVADSTCVEWLGSVGPGSSISRSGTWAPGCSSVYSNTLYARNYAFVMESTTPLSITLDSSVSDFIMMLSYPLAESHQPGDSINLELLSLSNIIEFSSSSVLSIDASDFAINRYENGVIYLIQVLPFNHEITGDFSLTLTVE